jgi:glycosyltransferase involved in cell wall biosynthesis
MNNPHPLISIILPAYREEENISLIYHELTNILQTLASQYRYEIIYVNDWSPDGTWREIDTLCQSDSHVKWVDLSRNFGKELALTAGIEAAQWDAIITLDVDGQHPVEHIPEFIARWEEWYDIVYNRRPDNHGASWIKRLTSRWFYRLFNLISEFRLEPGTTDYRLISRDVAESYLRFREKNRMYRGLVDWMGYSRYALVFDARERLAWEASYGYKQLFRLALHNLMGFSLFPLKLVGALGLTITTISSIMAVIVVIDKVTVNQFSFSNIVLIVILNTWILGITLMALGLIALYIANIHEEVIRRPLYIIKRKRNI